MHKCMYVSNAIADYDFASSKIYYFYYYSANDVLTKAFLRKFQTKQNKMVKISSIKQVGPKKSLEEKSSRRINFWENCAINI